MKTPISYAATLVIILVFTSCSTKKKSPAADINKLKEELVALQYEEDKAESARDFATLDKMLSEDLTIEFFADGGFAHIPSRDSFYRILRNSPPDTFYTKPLFEDIKVTTAGDTATMDYKVTFYEGIRDGDTISSYYHNIVNWLKVDGKWKTFAVQATLLPDKDE